MKAKKSRKVIAVVLLLIVIASMVGQTVALGAYTTSMPLNGTYKPLFSSGRGINAWVKITISGIPSGQRLNVRLKSAHGTVMQTMVGVLTSNGSASVWCPASAFSIEGQIAAFNLLGLITPARANAKIVV